MNAPLIGQTREGKYGRFHNAQTGYSVHPLRTEFQLGVFPKTIWRCKLSATDRLCWQDSQGYWQPDAHMSETDFGSTPVVIHWIMPPTEFPMTYYFHDAACRYGLLWFSTTYDGVYTARPVSRRQADAWMTKWMEAETICRLRQGWKRPAAYVGVRIGDITRLGR
jgi:hypothetical protein